MDTQSENDRPGREAEGAAEEILLENVDLARQGDQAASPQVAVRSAGKRRLLPPSRIAFLAFVAIAAVVIAAEIRARWTYTRSVQAINRAWEAAAQKGKPLYRTDIQRLMRGSPSSKYDRPKREEIFTWRGVRTRRLQVRYGRGEFVETYQTVDGGRGSGGPGDGEVSGDYGAALGYGTPGQAFEAHKQAMIARDWKRVLSVLTPEARQSMIGSAATVATVLARNDPEVANLLRRHGIDESMWNVPTSDVNPKDFVGLAKRIQEKQEALVAALEDKHAFYTEIMEHTQRAGERLRQQLGNSEKLAQLRAEAETAQEQVELIDVQIHGDTATGRQSLRFGGKTVDLPVYFKRIDGRWYVHIPQPNET